MILELISGFNGMLLPQFEQKEETHYESYEEQEYQEFKEYVEGGVIIDSSNYSTESTGITVVELPTEAETTETIEVIEFQNTTTYYGEFEFTAYTWTGNACSDGAYPTANYTAASNDPNLWHKWIYVDGIGDLYIHDTGGMAMNVIDVYVDTYDEAVAFGRKSASVYVYE